MASNQGNKDGWRTKGSKQLLTRDVIRACNLADAFEKQGVKYDITIFCHQDFEMQRARDAWAGFQEVGKSLTYKRVAVIKG